MNAPDPRLDSLLALLDRVRHSDADIDVMAGLEAYGGAVGHLRAVALDARRRIEHAAAVIADAREFARRRRRRAAKNAARI